MTSSLRGGFAAATQQQAQNRPAHPGNAMTQAARTVLLAAGQR
ncbi:hypothetical protein [Ideonella sp.]